MALKFATAMFGVGVAGVTTQIPDVVLATFDGAKGTTFKWTDMNDPVMGGASVSTFDIAGKAGVFNGTCAIVPSLKAPGFCKITTSSFIHPTAQFNDASAAVDGAIQLNVRSTTPRFAGFRVAFGSPDIPRTQFGVGSFKSGFLLTGDGKDWEVVSVPMSSFSYDWSSYTGRCDTKDPDGTQHHCCGAGNLTQYCPKANDLAAITGMEVWAEGVEGDFHLEVQWLGAVAKAPVPAKVCEITQYCCPDAKHCLTPTRVVCDPSASKNACGADQICCPITNVCVDVGAACVSPCLDQNSYCCPDALHCLTPVSPGKFCIGPGTQGSCAKSEICCPVTNECVSVGAACVPP